MMPTMLIPEIEQPTRKKMRAVVACVDRSLNETETA
jgi:hypothetical protein